MAIPSYVPNRLLNKIITREEVAHAVLNSKEGKALGFDQMYFEVIKNSETITIPEIISVVFSNRKSTTAVEESSYSPYPQGYTIRPKNTIKL